MRKIFFILSVITLLFACSDDEDNTTQNPIQNLKLPDKATTFLTGQSVTIEGKGFTTESQIWLRAAGTKATGDVQAKVTAVNESSITFEVPEGVEGQQTVILKQNGQEYDLGKLTFKRAEEKLYAYKTYGDTREIVEINIHTGKEKVIATLDNNGSYRETLIFVPSSNEVIGLARNNLVKIDLTNATSKMVKLSQNDRTDYDGLVIDNNDNVYAYKRYYPNTESYIKQIVKIDIGNGQEQVVATLDFNGTYFTTPAFMSGTREIIGIVDKALVKVNIDNGISKTVHLSQEEDMDYDNLVIDDNNNVYVYKRDYSNNDHYITQIVRININNGQEQVIANPDFNDSYFRNPTYIPSTKEITGWINNNLVKINITDGTKTTFELDQNKSVFYDGLVVGY